MDNLTREEQNGERSKYAPKMNEPFEDPLMNGLIRARKIQERMEKQIEMTPDFLRESFTD